jgi:anti-sigma B factor antagonist
MAVTEQITGIASGFSVRVEPAREVVWVKPIGELDLASCPELQQRVAELVAVGFEDLIIDLRGLSFLDVTGLCLLLELAGRARAERWRLALVQGDDRIRRIFALTGTLDELPFCGMSAGG